MQHGLTFEIPLIRPDHHDQSSGARTAHRKNPAAETRVVAVFGSARPLADSDWRTRKGHPRSVARLTCPVNTVAAPDPNYYRYGSAAALLQVCEKWAISGARPPNSPARVSLPRAFHPRFAPPWASGHVMPKVNKWLRYWRQIAKDVETALRIREQEQLKLQLCADLYRHSEHHFTHCSPPRPQEDTHIFR